MAQLGRGYSLSSLEMDTLDELRAELRRRAPELWARKEGHPHFGDKRADPSKANYKWSSLPVLNALVN